MSPFCTFGSLINLDFIQCDSFKFGKAFDEVNEFGSLSINLHLVMCKTTRMFNVEKLSKEGINSMLKIFSCENDVIQDGTILISSQSQT
jgi:hypothetical protein